MNKHVLWAATSTSTAGGIATYIRALRATPLWDEWGIEHLVTHRSGSVPRKCGIFALALLRFGAHVLLRRPDLVHLHTASYGSFARKSILAWICFTLRIPVVVHVHGGEFHVFYQRCPGLLRRYVRATLRRADRVLVLGASWASRIAAIEPSSRIEIVPNAVRIEAAAAWPRDDDPVRVLFLGKVSDRKGVYTLLDAWRVIVMGFAAGEHGRLTIAGDGDVVAARAYAAALGVADSVSLPGWVEPSAAGRLLRQSHIFVLPSMIEGQPMSILEAMAAGVCVVATHVGGIPDLLDERCGVLVDPGDADALVAALTRLISDPCLRAALAESALRRVHESFDVEAVWPRLDALYREVLQ